MRPTALSRKVSPHANCNTQRATTFHEAHWTPPIGRARDHVEFGYSVAYASGKFVVGARELGDDKIGAAFLYTL